MEREIRGNQEREAIFTAEVKLFGINPYVEAPAEVVATLGGGKKAPVLVEVANAGAEADEPHAPRSGGKLAKDAEQLKAIRRLAPGGEFRTTLVPSRSGPTRLYLDTWMRAAAGVGVGDQVQVRLQLDHGSRDLPVPVELLEALQNNEEAQAAWEALSPSRRREILAYLNFLKTPSALERNVRKTIARLLAK